jgi:hypothetical protein
MPGDLSCRSCGSEDGTALKRLVRLRDESPFFDRINHPHVRTVYPPVAEIVFALSASLAPDNVIFMKTVIVLFDVGALVLLCFLLRHLGLPPERMVVYAWCPLALKEFANSGHLDAIALFFATASVLAWLRRRPWLGLGLLAVATGAKLYPLVLLPFCLREIFSVEENGRNFRGSLSLPGPWRFSICRLGARGVISGKGSSSMRGSGAITRGCGPCFVSPWSRPV